MIRLTAADAVEKAASLPSLPGSATRILALRDDPNARATDAEQVLRFDPHLVAMVLRVANSAYLGLPGKVSSIRHAVTLLGWRKLSEVVVAASLRDVLARTVPGYELQPGELLHHSIAVSIAAEELARELGLRDVAETFTTALLHDIGKMVLADFLAAELPGVQARVAAGATLEQAEEAVIGVGHGEVGAYLLRQWSLPAHVVMAVRWHHDPDSSGQASPLTDVIHLADVLCFMLGFGVAWEGLAHLPSPAASARLGVTHDVLDTVASRTVDTAEELFAMLKGG
ncbi:MAG: HDOD domain-containing protein [Candidatus Schekmanbacteria bacterium]|nr:HDOD domain-containing protein [Candidatus Schekmanbacteria bacterium]